MAGQVWETSAEGAFLYSDELSDVLRTALQPLTRFRQLCDAKDATGKGLHKGNQFYWDVVSNVTTQGGALDERQAMPETGFTVSQESLTVTEYGNSVPYSGKLDNLSKLPVQDIVQRALKDDCVKTLEVAAHAQFNLCDKRVAAATSTTAVVTTTGATTATTNNVALGTGHIKAIADVMKEDNVPAFEGDSYFCVSHPTTLRPVYTSLESIHQYVDQGWQNIMMGERGKYDAVRFIEQNFIPKGGAIDSTTWNASTGTADAWNNALSSWAFFMGADTVVEAVVIPEEIEYSGLLH